MSKRHRDGNGEDELRGEGLESPGDKPRCFACHICAGEGYLEPELYPAGDKKICGYCLGILKKDGFLKLTGRVALLPDGQLKKHHALLIPELVAKDGQ